MPENSFFSGIFVYCIQKMLIFARDLYPMIIFLLNEVPQL